MTFKQAASLLTTILLLLLPLTTATPTHRDHPPSPTPTLPPTTTAPSVPPSLAPDFTDPSLFRSAVLNSTNTYRAQHNATDLAYNATLAAFAQDYLDNDVGPGDTCRFEHSGGPYGENLAIGYPSVAAGIEAWGDEREEYDFGRRRFSKGTGHFTQLVWRGTREVGCGGRWCGEGKGWYLVCEYWPAGNVVEGDGGRLVEGEVQGRVEGGAGRVGGWGGLWGVGVGVGVVLAMG
ncbi:CAP domain-containing protein [Podospora conica]|nr:CAP domain-containing protein [Schizothecium conicum]